MEFLTLIKEFWSNVFGTFDEGRTIASIFTLLTVFLLPIYALGVLKYVDALLYRVSQIFVRPINLLIYFLDKSKSSIQKMSFKHHVANAVFVIATIAMMVTEYKMIQEFLASQFTDGGGGDTIDLSGFGMGDNAAPEKSSSNVTFFGLFNISTASVLSLTYLSIATLLGFFAFELNSTFKSVYQHVFDPEREVEDNIADKHEKRFWIFSLVFLVPLFLLACIQGYLGYEREAIIVGSEKGTNYGTATLLVVTGVLIPVMAGIGLMSLHIFTAQIATLLQLFLQIIKDFIIAISLHIIALIDFLSALVTKTIILFLGVDGDVEKALKGERKKIGEKNSSKYSTIDKWKAHCKIRVLKRLVPAPVDEDGEDRYSIYIADKLDFQSEYTEAFWKKKPVNILTGNLVFVCSSPPIRYEKKFKEVYLLKQTFGDIENEIRKKHKSIKKEDKITFKVVDTLEEQPLELNVTEIELI